MNLAETYQDKLVKRPRQHWPSRLEKLYTCPGCGYILAIVTVEGPEFNGFLRCPDCKKFDLSITALSRRQAEVVKELTNGWSTRETADRLFVSMAAVDAHRRQIYKKLNIHNIPQLVKYALKHGLTTLAYRSELRGGELMYGPKKPKGGC